jgi:hypothetical protein
MAAASPAIPGTRSLVPVRLAGRICCVNSIATYRLSFLAPSLVLNRHPVSVMFIGLPLVIAFSLPGS